ncbi:MAG: M23 family metallopeptidase [Solirubrobacterales bacterium]|nr:M23 family metallopeptidase [Solirubrobacterales bacterium]
MPAGEDSQESARPQDAAPKRPGLVLPTVKAGLALALTTVAAAALGTLLGLPLPLLDQGTPSPGNAASVAGALGAKPVATGTAARLYHGPYHPAHGNYGYGEKDARFGASRSGHVHEGQDVFAKPGTTLVAVENGEVVDRGTPNGRYSGGRGNYLVIYSPLEDRSFVYMHMLHPAVVDKGERVTAGDPVGQLGCTGSCFGPHLHFEIRRGRAGFAADTKAIDPLPYLRQWPQAPAVGAT